MDEFDDMIEGLGDVIEENTWDTLCPNCYKGKRKGKKCPHCGYEPEYYPGYGNVEVISAEQREKLMSEFL